MLQLDRASALNYVVCSLSFVSDTGGPAECSAAPPDLDLVERLLHPEWGCCYGSYGSGKSTLLRSALAELRAAPNDHGVFVELKNCAVDTSPDIGAVDHAKRVFAAVVQDVLNELRNDLLSDAPRWRKRRYRRNLLAHVNGALDAVGVGLSKDFDYNVSNLPGAWEAQAAPNLRARLDRLDFEALREHLLALLDVVQVERLYILLDDWSSVAGRGELLRPALAHLLRSSFLGVQDRIVIKVAAHFRYAEFSYRTTAGEIVGLRSNDLRSSVDLDRALNMEERTRFCASVVLRRLTSSAEALGFVPSEFDPTAEELFDPEALALLSLASGPSARAFLDHVRSLAIATRDGEVTLPWSAAAAQRVVRDYVDQVTHRLVDSGALSSMTLATLRRASEAGSPTGAVAIPRQVDQAELRAQLDELVDSAVAARWTGDWLPAGPIELDFYGIEALRIAGGADDDDRNRRTFLVLTTDGHVNLCRVCGQEAPDHRCGNGCA